jgi:hypothetical protein
MKRSERIAILIIILALVSFVWLLVTPLPVDQVPQEGAPPRNPWGQHLPLDLDEVCDGTVLQWTQRCIELEDQEDSTETP